PSLGGIERALDRAQAEGRLLVIGMHGGMAENGELQAMCETRGVPFTGSGSASSHLAFDKVAAKRFAAIAGVKSPGGIELKDIDAVRNAARSEDYLIEPFVAGVEATCGVLERLDGSVVSLPTIEIVPAEG